MAAHNVSSSSESQSKPSSPPPAYTEIDPALQAPSSSRMNLPSADIPPTSPAAFPAHPGYGPTPIAQQTQLLPYYDPRSPHAIAEANARARWRFTSAFVWALALLMLASFVTGYEVQLRAHGTRVGGWWASE
ncbi:hypothetical protein WOLCODRAFT_117647 [Wolfiporia cocos MD-104 SS10]|uniref:Uncharacterized protein n=1 Tax=Wolfiporia cocos (strain MD-104) TaxID=742152 RepID=A0A2H3JEX2_WOLCO|nr:hypothetical protein WOLCODRAFT_117647 [Wolfiporia cocos MD-104 SS10]